ncbi:MAG: GNAT family N-acetyltransferase [Pseudomonadota bacterium]
MTTRAEIAVFEAGHIDGALLLSQAAGWSHGRRDWKMLLRLSTGCIALNEGQVVGTGFRTDFGAELSALSMIIVSEAMRSQGLGCRLMTNLMQPGDARAYRLIATRTGRPLYEKLGFEEVDQILTLRGPMRGVPQATIAQAGTARDRDALALLESASYGGDRTALVDWLLSHAKLAVIRDEGAVKGYAAMRPFAQGHVIGPVVSQTVEDAQALITQLVQDSDGDFVRIDVTRASGLAPWLQTLGLELVDAPPVMQRGVSALGADRKAAFSQALG